MTFTVPPDELYSASLPRVWIEISWIASYARLLPNVCVTGSVVLTPSSRYVFCATFAPETIGFDPPPEPGFASGAWKSTF